MKIFMSLIILIFSTPSRASEMILIKGGEFLMGADHELSTPPERPAHKVVVADFSIDKTEVTNEDFKKFIDQTKYVTVAERKPKWEELKEQLPPGTEKISDEQLIPGSSVFIPPKKKIELDDPALWWKWVAGAHWKNPEGPGSEINERMKHPVVHVAFEDAQRYCQWLGKRLPSEMEWEYASRGGLQNKIYAWGDEFILQGKYQANTFQGHFPYQDTQLDGYGTLAPVGQFPANGHGLYDMIGNAWEWVDDWYDDKLYQHRQTQKSSQLTATKCHDSEDPYAKKRVIKGGSFLCSAEYCSNYRPSARRGTAFDTGMSHISFRCAK